MSDFITLDPKDISVEDLERAAHGGSLSMKPQLAVVLLKAKLGLAAEPHLMALASDDQLDVRVRRVAIEELSQSKGAKELLKGLTRSANPVLSEAASRALSAQEHPQ
jgi:hypothetical protein